MNFLNMKKIEIEIPEGKELKLVNGVYTLVDEQNITERIKTFEDACRELGNNHPFVKEWQMCGAGLSSDLDAYLRLRIIIEALNEGWKPQFNKDEKRWYFWFYVIDTAEYNKLLPEKKLHVVYRGIHSIYLGGCVSFVHASTYNSGSFAIFGSHLAFKNKKLAEYAGKQFTNLYIKFCF